MQRPSKDSYYIAIAKAVAERSTCLRRKYGAVIVKDDEIIATGYNGAPRGEVNCCDTGTCSREEAHIPHGERYELCHSVHAEMNAIISASRAEMKGSSLYLAGFDCNAEKWMRRPMPCDICRRMIKNAGIDRVVTIPDSETF